MKLSYVDLFGDSSKRHEVDATITTEHSASSYGQPVILLEDGSPLDISSWVLLDYRAEEIAPEEQELWQRFTQNLDFALSTVAD